MELPNYYHQVTIYDPTAPGYCRQVIVESYWDNGVDVTQKIVDKHTALLLQVVGLNQTLALLEERPNHLTDYAREALRYHELPKAQAALARLEEQWMPLKNYRSHRLPFK